MLLKMVTYISPAYLMLICTGVRVYSLRPSCLQCCPCRPSSSLVVPHRHYRPSQALVLLRCPTSGSLLHGITASIPSAEPTPTWCLWPGSNSSRPTTGGRKRTTMAGKHEVEERGQKTWQLPLEPLNPPQTSGSHFLSLLPQPQLPFLTDPPQSQPHRSIGSFEYSTVIGK